MSQVAVIGAGVSGLAAAHALCRAGVKVDVFEAADRAGGLIGSDREAGFLLERAANGFLPAQDGAAAMCAQLGVTLCQAAPAAKNRWIFSDGRLRPVPTSPRALLSGELLSRRGVLRAVLEPLMARRPAGEESIAALARRRLGAEVADKLVAPFVAGVFAGDAEVLSARAAFPRLFALEAQGGFAIGGLRQALAARQSGEGRAGGRKAGRRTRRLSAPVAGLEALPRAMAENLASSISFETPVAAIARDGAEVAVTLDAETRRYAAVIAAVPAPAAARLLSTAAPAASRALSAIPFAPVAVAHLGFRREDIEHPLDGFGFLARPGEGLGILGALFESSLWPGRAPAGCVLVRVMLGGAREPDIAALPDDALFAQSQRALDAALGVRAKPVLARARRIPAAIAQYTAGHTERVATADAAAAALGVTLCGMSYRGVGANDAIRDGLRAARAVLSRLGGAAALALAVALAACSGASQSQAVTTAQDDSGIAADKTAGEPGPVRADAPGAIAVDVRWKNPPREPRQMPPRTRCGNHPRPRLRAHLLGGIADFVVSLRGEQAAAANQAQAENRASPRLSIDACRLEPAVQVIPDGEPLIVELASGPRQQVSIEHLGMPEAKGDGADPAAAEKLADLALAIPGQGYAVTLPAGLARVTLKDEPGARAYVATGIGPAAVTDERGRAKIDQVSPGRYQVLLWHAPLSRGAAPLAIETTATVKPGKTAEVTVWLDDHR